jgi:hypothetical protein
VQHGCKREDDAANGGDSQEVGFRYSGRLFTAIHLVGPAGQCESPRRRRGGGCLQRF